MRQLSKITAPIQPYIIRSAPSYARRRVNPVQDTFTAIVMIRHDETETELFVSDDDRRRRGLDSQAAHPSRPQRSGQVYRRNPDANRCAAFRLCGPGPVRLRPLPAGRTRRSHRRDRGREAQADAVLRAIEQPADVGWGKAVYA